MSQHIGPRVISATGGSIKRVGSYRIHTFPSELVTDGLVLNLDAGDPRSYPGSGLTWTDLSGNGNTGTFGAGSSAPTYSNANGGSIVFDGSDDYITLPSNTSISSSQITIEAWALHTNSSQTTSFIGGYGDTGNQGYWLGKNGSTWGFSIGAGGSNYYQLAGSTYSSNTVVHLIGTFDGSIMKFYMNGILSTTYGVSGNISYSGVIPYIGQITGLSTNRYWTGSIYAFRIYNRALSAAEVAQNYDALKVRYTSYTNTFTPLCGGASGKVEVLCVAGGGGGSGGDVGSGGGAGGLIYNSAFSVNSNSPISVTIGAGGAGTGSNVLPGTNGGNSVFSTLTSIGGGAGGSWSGGTGLGGNGGSGGGGWITPSSGTLGQGYAGGIGIPGTNYPAGGGGGAGGVGMTATSQLKAGDGGPGLLYSISGTSQYYAGGGGGSSEANSNGASVALGLGGSGVGGTGGRQTSRIQATSAIPNTGSGGGGDDPGFGGNGSNGIVIVRYPAADYNVEVLVVGGGGGAGEAGGGAGGLIYHSSYPVSAGTKYSVTVGAGGQAGGANSKGGNGANSIFGPLVAIGGGAGGGGQPPSLGNNGGSGGGTSAAYGVISGVALGTPGQGNNGGAQSFTNGSLYAAGGGGGAGAVGGNGSSVTGGGVGGIGLAFSISGSSTYYAGGGAGVGYVGSWASSSGGLGGGGSTNSGVGSAGTPNTGGGAGGTIYNMSGVVGGSGIVIIAYRGPQRGIGGVVDTTSRPGYTLHKFTAVGTDIFIP